MTRYVELEDEEEDQYALSVVPGLSSEESGNNRPAPKRGPPGLTMLSTTQQGLQNNHQATSSTHRGEIEISHQLSKRRRKSKSTQQLQEIQRNQQRKKSKFASPPPEVAHGDAAGKNSSKRSRTAHPDASKLSHYTNELKEVIDEARTTLAVYLFTENAFPGDEVPPASAMRDGSQGPVKWRKVLDHFFYESVATNEDASRADPPLKSNDKIRMAINAKQSSVRNAAFEAARLVVEQQYKIEDGNGWKSNAQEIQALVARELDGEPLQWTTFNGIFLHPSIPAIIAKICFTKTGLCVGLSPKFSPTFNPTPLPLIAFAATLCYAVLSSWRTGVWQSIQFSANRYRRVYSDCTQALLHMSRTNEPICKLLTRGTYHFCMEQARAAGKLAAEEPPSIELTRLRLPEVPRFELQEEDYQNPWHNNASPTLQTAPGARSPPHAPDASLDGTLRYHPPIPPLSPPPQAMLQHGSAHSHVSPPPTCHDSLRLGSSPGPPTHETSMHLHSTSHIPSGSHDDGDFQATSDHYYDDPQDPRSSTSPRSLANLLPPHPLSHGLPSAFHHTSRTHSPLGAPSVSRGASRARSPLGAPPVSRGASRAHSPLGAPPASRGASRARSPLGAPPVSRSASRARSPLGAPPASHGASRARSPLGAPLHTQASRTMHVHVASNASGRHARKRKQVTYSSGDEVEADLLPSLPSNTLGRLKSRQPLRVHQAPKTPFRPPPADPPLTRLRSRVANPAIVTTEATPSGSKSNPWEVPASSKRAGLRQRLHANKPGQN